MTPSSSPRLAAADLAEIEAEAASLRADRKLLAETLKWARSNGYSRTRDYEMGQFAGYSWEPAAGRVHFCPHGDPVIYCSGSAIQPESAREAVDVLVALGILPAQLSSAFAAGRESLLADFKAMVDPYDPADADERAENDAERIAEMTPDELARWGE